MHTTKDRSKHRHKVSSTTSIAIYQSPPPSSHLPSRSAQSKPTILLKSQPKFLCTNSETSTSTTRKCREPKSELNELCKHSLDRGLKPSPLRRKASGNHKHGPLKKSSFRPLSSLPLSLPPSFFPPPSNKGNQTKKQQGVGIWLTD